MKIPHHNRYDYSPIVARPDYSWPQDRRLAVYVVLAIEHFAFGTGLGHMISAAHPAPDPRAYGWRDYGNRVGVWRILDMLNELELPACALVNTAIIDYAPQIVEALIERKDEILGHGRTNAERQAEMFEEDETRVIASVRDAIASFPGSHQPRGWLGPWLSESNITPDLLQEAGFTYVCDWGFDDQPVWMRTRCGRIMSMPYSADFNDSTQMLVHHHSADTFADMLIARIDEMVRQSEKQPLVCAISIHPMICAQPHRLPAIRRALRHLATHAARDAIWITRPGQIYEHCCRLGDGIVP